MASSPSILYCHCAYADILPAAVKQAVLAGLGRSGVRFEAVPDLCELAAMRDPSLRQFAQAAGPLHVIACHGRAVRWLLAAAGALLPASAVVHNMRTQDAAAILASVGTDAERGGSPDPSRDRASGARRRGGCGDPPRDHASGARRRGGCGDPPRDRASGARRRGGCGDPPRKAVDVPRKAVDVPRKAVDVPRKASDVSRKTGREIPAAALPHFPAKADGEPTTARAVAVPGWIPWFPVIDYDRCEGCRQCVEFCLFGTYAVDEGGVVRVVHPEKCKTNCPACARVCPHSAIIFPKFADGPISGDEGRLTGSQEAGVAGDMAGLPKADVMALLKRRNAAHARAAAAGAPLAALGVPGVPGSSVIPSERSESRNLDVLPGTRHSAQRDPSTSLGVTASVAQPESRATAKEPPGR